MRIAVFLLLLVTPFGVGFAQHNVPELAAALTIVAVPEHPLIELGDEQQLLNFDFAVSNHGRSTWRLSEIEIETYDEYNKLVTRKTVNSNGLSPSVNIVSKALLSPGDAIDVFNPFYSFPVDSPIAKLQYCFRYNREDDATEAAANQHRVPLDFDTQVRVTVIPRHYSTKTDLILPMMGRVLVWEGHDFYAHHRRVPLQNPKVQQMGVRANSNRFAFDFEIVDKEGRMYHGDPYDKRNWYCYGEPVYAPGAGKVMTAENSIPDNWFEGRKVSHPDLPASADPKGLGNYVLIDHGDGEYSVLNHMLAGSVAVKTGDSVRRGQMIGRIGFAGDTIFPHLHFSLLSGPGISQDEGVPASFTKYRRLLGTKSVEVRRGTVDSGDFLVSEATYDKNKTERRDPTHITPVP